jgi:general secretion pathway protein J
MAADKSLRRRGFTLIELLVAISIMAIVAVLGWRGLDGIVRARLALNNELEQTRGMQLAFAQLQNDCAQIADKMTVANRMTLVINPNRLVMIRMVFADNQPSRVQVVTYRLHEGKLLRNQSVPTRNLAEIDAAWNAALIDADISDAVVLQSNVSAMAMRIWHGSTMEWNNDSGDQNAEPPTGLEVGLQLNGQSTGMTKIFLLGPV